MQRSNIISWSTINRINAISRKDIRLTQPDWGSGRGPDSQCWVKMKESEGKEISRCGLQPGRKPDTKERDGWKQEAGMQQSKNSGRGKLMKSRSSEKYKGVEKYQRVLNFTQHEEVCGVWRTEWRQDFSMNATRIPLESPEHWKRIILHHFGVILWTDYTQGDPLDPRNDPSLHPGQMFHKSLCV